MEDKIEGKAASKDDPDVVPQEDHKDRRHLLKQCNVDAHVGALADDKHEVDPDCYHCVCTDVALYFSVDGRENAEEVRLDKDGEEEEQDVHVVAYCTPG